jgi:hypothetical protein
MENNIPNQSVPNRRRKKRPKWQRVLRKYWPTIRFGIIVIVLLVLVIQMVSCAINGIAESTEDRRDDRNDEISATDDAPAPAKPSKKELDAQAEQLISNADFVAAGYDYKKATEMLQSFEYFDEYPAMAERISEYEKLDQQLVPYARMDQVTHIFFHSLIADPSRAFDGEYTDDGYNLYMTTLDEFNAILQQMYDRGFVLVTPYQVAGVQADGTFGYNEIRLPEGKQPFIMSQDDLNYYGYMIGAKHSYGDDPIFVSKEGDGFAHRIVIGEDGYPTCEYMDKDGNISTGDYDMVPALETFIQTHPDFAYQGARGVLGMTGYEGVFGYRTAPKYESALGTERYQQEVEAAKAVAECLKEHGWILASHSYGHPAYGNLTPERVEADSDKWEATCEYIIGETDILLYPHGSDIGSYKPYTMDNGKFAALYEDGYRYFFNVDSVIAWTQVGDNYFRGSRRNIDGYRMFHHPEKLSDLFDVSSVFDPARPTPVPKI